MPETNLLLFRQEQRAKLFLFKEIYKMVDLNSICHFERQDKEQPKNNIVKLKICAQKDHKLMVIRSFCIHS